MFQYCSTSSHCDELVIDYDRDKRATQKKRCVSSFRFWLYICSSRWIVMFHLSRSMHKALLCNASNKIFPFNFLSSIWIAMNVLYMHSGDYLLLPLLRLSHSFSRRFFGWFAFTAVIYVDVYCVCRPPGLCDHNHSIYSRYFSTSSSSSSSPNLATAATKKRRNKCVVQRRRRRRAWHSSDFDFIFSVRWAWAPLCVCMHIM